MSGKMLTASSGLASAASRRTCLKPFQAARPIRLANRSRCVQTVRATAEAVVEPVSEVEATSSAVVGTTLSCAQLVQSYETDMKRNVHPTLEIGDQVIIEFIVIERSAGPARDKMGNLLKSSADQKDKERVQKCQGIIIARHGSGLNMTYTFRRVFQGIGIEIVFPIHSPQVKSIQILRHSKVRRAKLHYLRGKIGKKARLTARKDKRPVA